MKPIMLSWTYPIARAGFSVVGEKASTQTSRESHEDLWHYYINGLSSLTGEDYLRR